MQKKQRAEKIKALKQSGYKLVTGYSSLYVNPHGKIYNLQTGKHLKPNAKNLIKPENKYLSVPKVVLQTFANEPYRNGHITYIDSNNQNLNVQNLKYRSVFAPGKTPESLNRQSLLTAIRCYMPVKKGYNVKDAFQTRFYLKLITEQRQFFTQNNNLPYYEVFQTYINGKNISKTAQIHSLSVRDCSIIISQFTELLTSEILKDLKSGFLAIQPYIPKPPTKTQILKEYNKGLIERGKKPLPLKKQSTKQPLPDLLAKIKEIRKQTPPTD